MTDADAWWLLAGLLLTVAGFISARHIPGGRALTDGNPPGPPTYTAITEQADDWLRELPADTNPQGGTS